MINKGQIVSMATLHFLGKDKKNLKGVLVFRVAKIFALFLSIFFTIMHSLFLHEVKAENIHPLYTMTPPFINHITFPNTQSNVKNLGKVIVVHGLNTKPTEMDELSLFLSNSGYEVYRVSLAGHESGLLNPKEVKSEDWVKPLGEWIENIQKKEEGLPLFFIGYSLGGLVGEVILKDNRFKIHFMKMVLLAPALYIRKSMKVFKPLTHVLSDRFTVPSFTPKAARANKGTAVAMYASTFQLVEQYKILPEFTSHPETLVFGDYKDELVDIKKVEKRCNEHPELNLKFLEIKKDSEALYKYHHMLVNKKSLGKNKEPVFQTILSFISQRKNE